MLLTLSNYISLIKVRQIALPRVNWGMFYAISAASFAITAIFCALWVNQITNGIYFADKYEKEIRALYKENKMLEAKYAESGFLGKVSARMKELNFEKTEEVKYIQILDASLARAK